MIAWRPLDETTLSAIRSEFLEIFPEPGHSGLAERISAYWIDMLNSVWENKPDRIRQKDLDFDPADPLSRIEPRIVVIAYADSVQHGDEPTLDTLDRFLGDHFPAARGLHLLPACRVVEDRFNDGYFSQVERSRVHQRIGTNRRFADLMEKYFSMADFVLNHVDIENPNFRAYLDGDNAAAECFYVFSEAEYFRRKAAGDFDWIFRPRPFPLFTIFRRRPADEKYAGRSFEDRCAAVNERLAPDALAEPVIGILSVFDKAGNDQMLLEEDYHRVIDFMMHLEKTGIDPETLFSLSETQETQHPPYIFKDSISSRADLLAAIGYDRDTARHIADVYEQIDPNIFGEPVRAMTTFSHVQVDVNTSTFAGLRMLADDFSWYLGLDLNMLRLDAANYAFKKWKTSCFGLPEVHRLMRVLYLSKEAVSPRIVANLEVNDTLGTILSRMADRNAPPPMMYDFHLACILPAVFNSGDARIPIRIFEKIAEFDIPKDSIRFSVAESHDGKSVRGSLDLLTIAERHNLTEIAERNGGRIKYKTVPKGRIQPDEFGMICREAGMERNSATLRLFENPDAAADGMLILKADIRTPWEIAAGLGITMDEFHSSNPLRFFADKVIHGREPYELCVSTRDALARIDDPKMDAARYLAFYTMAFAMMGRNVKSIYFNDLIGLPNDYERMERTGELRDIKRTRSDYEDLAATISDENSIHHAIAEGIDRLIAIVDSDPALGPRGDEAEILPSGDPVVAMIHNHCGDNHSLIVINTAPESKNITLDLKKKEVFETAKWIDRIDGRTFEAKKGTLEIVLAPFGRLWLTVFIPISASRQLQGKSSIS